MTDPQQASPAALAAENARLREALEPFAEEALSYEEEIPDDAATWPTFCVGHFRRARAAFLPNEGG
jgi:RecB family exonuclease